MQEQKGNQLLDLLCSKQSLTMAVLTNFLEKITNVFISTVPDTNPVS